MGNLISPTKYKREHRSLLYVAKLTLSLCNNVHVIGVSYSTDRRECIDCITKKIIINVCW